MTTFIEKKRAAVHKTLQNTISEQKPYLLRHQKHERKRILYKDIVTSYTEYRDDCLWNLTLLS